MSDGFGIAAAAVSTTYGVALEELLQILDAIQRNAPDAFWFHHDIEGISSRYHIEPIG